MDLDTLSQDNIKLKDENDKLKLENQELITRLKKYTNTQSHRNYYEIHNTNENQYIAGRPELSFSLILNGHLTELSHTNIGERLT